MHLKHYDHDCRARFITFCTHKKLQILSNNIFRNLLLDAIRNARVKHGFQLIGYVIMPEHVHLVLIPKTTTKIGSMIGEIKRISATEILAMIKDPALLARLTVNRNRSGNLSCWQRRCFDHNCRTEKAMWQTIDYCHYNPIKRKLVKKAEDWIWSSDRWYKGMDRIMIDMDEY